MPGDSLKIFLSPSKTGLAVPPVPFTAALGSFLEPLPSNLWGNCPLFCYIDP
ncbi:predicted protein [Pyrenophora tritici-repentis Pt-1C-BFP]|uniref:Uncharacterized protein n=1 Tax=Pyrenophora tritici-repentis (strain Pt-1C-BFP) TaxID=426418 RepID=B2WBR1_PYRTR|nr:uncharacterized protein PTRG_07074 [Pyrenophora tritici-repentis Pt-1C-BFP]EDU49993.1 predicted protein [Pyrenophora tritici-repentis Pt-1C-BFP]